MGKFTSHKAFGHDLISWQMHFKMLFMIGCFLLSIYFIFFSLSARIFLGSESSNHVRTWCVSKALSPLLPGHELSLYVKGKVITASAAEFARSATLKKLVFNFGNALKLFFAALVPLPIFLFFPKILGYYREKEQIRLRPKYIDGAKLLPPPEYKAQIEAKYSDTYLPFGGWYDDQDKFHSINLPTEVENAHIIMFGGTRAGKTALLSQMLDALRRRGDICLILDQKGDYISTFFQPNKDHIFNVLDERCMYWSFWDDLDPQNKLMRKAELETVAAGLIPQDQGDKNKFFCDAARAVFVGLCIDLDRKQKYTYADLWSAINQPREKIALILEDIGHKGHVYISEPGKQSQGVLSTLIEYSSVFEFATILDKRNDNTFTLTDWLANGQGFVYLSNLDFIREILRPSLSLFINFLAKKILSNPENIKGRRIWLFLDEFGSLHKLPTLIDILTRGGSKGICAVLATQDRGQTEETYGRNLTDVIFNACNSWAALRCKDPSIANLIVDRVGEWRFRREEESVTDKIDDGGDSVNISKRIYREKLLLDSDIMGQKKLHAYIHIDGCNFSQVEIEHKFFDPHCPSFIPHTDVDLSSLPNTAIHNSEPVNFADLDMEVGV